MKLVVVLVIVLMLFTGFSIMSFHSSVQKNKISIDNFNVQSTNHICSYFQINIKNSPSGTGYYQQLFILTNPILLNSLNANRSNFYIASSNNTFFYTWIEAYNTTSLTIWSKIPNGTTSVNFEVFPKIENLFSSTGYLGEFSEIKTGNDNYRKVFNWYYNNVSYTGQSIGNYNMTGFIAYFRSIISLGFIQLQNVSNNQNPMLYNYSGYGVFQIYNGGGDVNIYNFSIPTTQISGYYEYVYESNGSNIWYSGLNNKNHETSYSISLSKWRISGGGSSNFDLNYLIPLTNTLSMPTFTASSTPIMFAYHIQLKSFNNQNIIKNYFKYNNNIYNSLTNTFTFTNSSKFPFSIFPENYTIFNTSYLSNTSIINIKQNQYTSANFINYYYNISISYFSKTSTPINYYSPPNYYFTIGIIIFLLIGGLIIYTKIRNGD